MGLEVLNCLVKFIVVDVAIVVLEHVVLCTYRVSKYYALQIEC